MTEAMPPCLSDRIVEDSRRGRESERWLPTGVPKKNGMSLAGGFLFVRGVFYVTRPAPGEASTVEAHE